MKKWHLYFALLMVIFAFTASADPQQDQALFRQHYQKLFPQLTLNDYADGVYALDEISRGSWQTIEEFPPYELAIEQGETLFNAPFKNGKHYSDCLPDNGIAISHLYPRWDETQNKVITLALAINHCREENNETSLPYQKGEIAQLLAYMAYTSRGKAININIPDSSPMALASYEQGKQYYYQRRGQLNFSCSSCHVKNAGKKIRAEMLSPSLGHTSNWPTYRLKWGEMGTLHRRIMGCHKQIRAEIPTAQSDALRHLEYFLSFMGNGIPFNGPSTRK
jgi:sulfur-oxidizing protein SoxA